MIKSLFGVIDFYETLELIGESYSLEKNSLKTINWGIIYDNPYKPSPKDILHFFIGYGLKNISLGLFEFYMPIFIKFSEIFIHWSICMCLLNCKNINFETYNLCLTSCKCFKFVSSMVAFSSFVLFSCPDIMLRHALLCQD